MSAPGLVDFTRKYRLEHNGEMPSLIRCWEGALKYAEAQLASHNSAMPKLDEHIVEWFRGYIADFEPDLYALAGRLRTILEFIESVQLRHSA